MGQQIVKQPDGKFAIWSSVVDDFVVVDCDNADDLIDVMVENAKTEIAANVLRVLDQLAKGEKPYHQFTKTFPECVEIIKAIHGSSDSLAMMDMNR